MQGRAETKRGDQVVGSYQYSDGNVKVKVVYAADDNGYRVLKEERVTLKPFTDPPRTPQPSHPRVAHPDPPPRKNKGKSRPRGSKPRPKPPSKQIFKNRNPPEKYSSSYSSDASQGTNLGSYNGLQPLSSSSSSQQGYDSDIPELESLGLTLDQSSYPQLGSLGLKQNQHERPAATAGYYKPSSTETPATASPNPSGNKYKNPEFDNASYAVKLRTNHGTGFSHQGFNLNSGGGSQRYRVKDGTPVYEEKPPGTPKPPKDKLNDVYDPSRWNSRVEFNRWKDEQDSKRWNSEDSSESEEDSNRWNGKGSSGSEEDSNRWNGKGPSGSEQDSNRWNGKGSSGSEQDSNIWNGKGSSGSEEDSNRWNGKGSSGSEQDSNRWNGKGSGSEQDSNRWNGKGSPGSEEDSNRWSGKGSSGSQIPSSTERNPVNDRLKNHRMEPIGENLQADRGPGLSYQFTSNLGQSQTNELKDEGELHQKDFSSGNRIPFENDGPASSHQSITSSTGKSQKYQVKEDEEIRQDTSTPARKPQPTSTEGSLILDEDQFNHSLEENDRGTPYGKSKFSGGSVQEIPRGKENRHSGKRTKPKKPKLQPIPVGPAGPQSLAIFVKEPPIDPGVVLFRPQPSPKLSSRPKKRRTVIRVRRPIEDRSM